MIITIDCLCRRECKTQDQVPVLNWWSGQGALMPWSPLHHSVWNQCSLMSGFLSGLDKGDFNRWCLEASCSSGFSPDSLDSTGRNEGALLWREVPVLVLSVSGQVLSSATDFHPPPRVFNSVVFYGRLDIVRLEWLSAGNWCKSTKRSMTPVRRLCAPQWPIWKDALYKCLQTFRACEPWFF